MYLKNLKIFCNFGHLKRSIKTGLNHGHVGLRPIDHCDTHVYGTVPRSMSLPHAVSSDSPCSMCGCVTPAWNSPQIPKQATRDCRNSMTPTCCFSCSYPRRINLFSNIFLYINMLLSQTPLKFAFAGLKMKHPFSFCAVCNGGFEISAIRLWKETKKHHLQSAQRNLFKKSHW